MSQRSSRHGCAVFAVAASLIACSAPGRAPEPAPAAPRPETERAERTASVSVPTTQPVTAAEGAETRARPESLVHGYVSTRYRARWSGSDDDHDFDTVLGLDVGDARKDRVSGHLMARASADLDGASANDPFFSLRDTYDHDVTARLYYAWADLKPDAAEKALVERWRLGRQIDYFTPELAWFDGVSAQSRPRGEQEWQLGLYGGVPVHLNESSASGDSMFGAFVQANPWKRTHVRADWMHLEDETRLAEHENDLLALDVSQTLGEGLRLAGKYTHLEERPRDVRVQASWSDLPNEWTLFLSYFELLRTQRSFALEVDPFFTTLLEQFPYRQARLLASKSIADWLLLQGGADVRRMSDDSDIGQFNRDFERVFLTSTIGDPLPWKLSLSLTGEVWHSPDTDIQTWGADVARRFGKTFDASLGSYYALFKYDLFSIDERDDVRTYYFSLRWKRTKDSVFDVRYEFEDSDFGDFQTLRMGAKWQF